MKLQFLLVETLQELVRIWDIIEPGLENILQYSHKDDDEEFILDQLATRSMFLVLITCDDNYCGFFTIRFINSYYNGKIEKCLIPNHFFMDESFQHKNIWVDVEQYIEQFAIKSNCKIIKTYTMRNVEKRMNKCGYKKTYTEYVKEL